MCQGVSSLHKRNTSTTTTSVKDSRLRWSDQLSGTTCSHMLKYNWTKEIFQFLTSCQNSIEENMLKYNWTKRRCLFSTSGLSRLKEAKNPTFSSFKNFFSWMEAPYEQVTFNIILLSIYWSINHQNMFSVFFVPPLWLSSLLKPSQSPSLKEQKT